MAMHAYEKITFEEAVKIIYYQYGTKSPAIFKTVMEDLITRCSEPYKSISPSWYEDYQQFLEDNKTSK